MNLTEKDLEIILTYLEHGKLPTLELYGKTMTERINNTLEKNLLIQKLQRLKDDKEGHHGKQAT